jgi:hypothetical protein
MYNFWNLHDVIHMSEPMLIKYSYNICHILDYKSFL